MARIEQDHFRFRQIVKGRVRRDLRKFMSKGEMLGRQGSDRVSIPLPQIDIPRFRYGGKQTGGVGIGEGNLGDAIGKQDGQAGTGPAGEGPGEHLLEVDVTMDELAEILGEELQLPRIEPRGKENIVSDKERYTGIRRVGPESLRHFKRTYKRALKRQISAGSYNPDRPLVIPVKEDKLYRSWKVTRRPESNAVIVYMLDVSGSMGDEQKEIVRIEAFWIDTWLRNQYQNVECRYIVHDAAARLVDQHTFYHTRESGGTKISSAYELCKKMVEDHFPPDEWNVYCFHFSDGDNWGDDNTSCMRLLREQLLPKVNLFCYGQVTSPYGSGQFAKELRKGFPEKTNLITSIIADKDAIYDSIKEFLGTGR
ncbi:MAG: DUF444 family protein [Candidatus Schekmanbacteria bacterium]|nr:DUF444 family protein [Candidatus Schekmanbacteria bacterium]